MPKLPLISGEQAVKCFKKIGYRVIRQRGSHIRLLHKTDENKQPLTIPAHKVLGKGLLRKILRDSRLTVEEFIRLVK